MTDQDENQPAEEFHRDRREHGGIPGHLDDDQLARLTEEERVEAGLDDFDPDEVPGDAAVLAAVAVELLGRLAVVLLGHHITPVAVG